MRHVEMQVEHRRRLRPNEQDSEGHAVRELRRHVLWYTRGRRGGATFRRDATRLNTVADVRRQLELHFPPGGDAFEPDPAAAPVDDGEAGDASGSE
jgi:tRNA-dihydrouridine synthase